MTEVALEFLGIDVGKKDLHAALLQGERSSFKSIPNSATGIKQLIAWLKNRKAENVHVCLEATGGWSEEVATALHEVGYTVSIVNPCRVKAFAKSEMVRTKTDAVDATLIARFCRMHTPERWTPPQPEIRMLQALVRRYQSLSEMRVEELNRLSGPVAVPTVITSIKTHLEHLDEEMERILREINELFKNHPPLSKQRDLLLSIPGIGELTATRILGEMPNITEFHDVKAVVAYVGLSPRHYQSGTIRRSSRLAKIGNKKLRSALYFPAVSAMRFNPLVKALTTRLEKAGKAKMCIIAAAMRKLIVLAYGVLKSGVPFDPAYAA